MTDNEGITTGPAFSDRKLLLGIFGILLILFGLFTGLMAAFIILGMAMSSALDHGSAPAMDARMMIPGALFYFLIAAWFICMGIGSIGQRRWARALVLLSSWVWLLSGVAGLIGMLAFMPGMFKNLPIGEEVPQAVIQIMMFVMLAVMLVFYVLIPGVLVLVYGGKNVKATCEYWDPHLRWTDRCPLPVLAVSLVSGVTACSMPFMGFYGWAVPFFGVIVSGATGLGVVLVAMALCAYVAWGAYKLRITAWWCAIFVTIAWALSTCITFSRVSILEFYEYTNFPEQQLEMMKQLGMPDGSVLVPIYGLWFIAVLGYLVYTRRFFRTPLEQASADAEASHG